MAALWLPPAHCRCPVHTSPKAVLHFSTGPHPPADCGCTMCGSQAPESSSCLHRDRAYTALSMQRLSEELSPYKDRQ